MGLKKALGDGVATLFGLKSKEHEFQFRCEDCGDLHTGSPSFGFNSPVFYLDIPEAEREDRCYLDTDLCRIDDDMFFIRCVLEIPIQDAKEPFLWGVWVSQSEDSFRKFEETMSGGQSDFLSFGWLTVAMRPYLNDEVEDLVSLECDVVGQPGDARPKIILWENQHRLYHDQMNGISWAEAIAQMRMMLHG